MVSKHRGDRADSAQSAGQTILITIAAVVPIAKTAAITAIAVMIISSGSILVGYTTRRPSDSCQSGGTRMGSA
jgi:hypothetical protein